MGYRHMYGYDVPASCASAEKYYKAAAALVLGELADGKKGTVLENLRLSNEEARAQPADTDEDVVKYFEHAADAGNVNAQLTMGHIHFYGARGVPRNPEQAARYFRAAAAAHDTKALVSLAHMHAMGTGVKQENETAFRLFSEAAEKGDSNAQNGLGYLHLHGQGTPRDVAMALK